VVATGGGDGAAAVLTATGGGGGGDVGDDSGATRSGDTGGDGAAVTGGGDGLSKLHVAITIVPSYVAGEQISLMIQILANHVRDVHILCSTIRHRRLLSEQYPYPRRRHQPEAE